MDTREVVERFWQAMAAHDWAGASALLHEDCLIEWPQSGESFRGREGFAAAGDPAADGWRFTLNRLVAEGETAASDVSVSDGSVEGRVLSFFEVRDGRISRLTEVWPEPAPAGAPPPGPGLRS